MQEWELAKWLSFQGEGSSWFLREEGLRRRFVLFGLGGKDGSHQDGGMAE